MRSALILLAGTSEAGKSTAGTHLAARGARRIKIRTILTTLTSGTPVEHEGVTMRENFDPAEFLTAIVNLPETDDPPVLMVESFIDAALAEATVRVWPGPVRIVFITAPRTVRIGRLARARGVDIQQAARIVDAKDGRKHVVDQWEYWRRIATDWIDNDGDLATFFTRLDRLLATAHTSLTNHATLTATDQKGT
ncbi:MAG: hypothetical protein KJO75_02620 [Dactylosporangium sp.]|nr:hypothetical protein [Dactylosporangium sp.]